MSAAPAIRRAQVLCELLKNAEVLRDGARATRLCRQLMGLCITDGDALAADATAGTLMRSAIDAMRALARASHTSAMGLAPGCALITLVSYASYASADPSACEHAAIALAPMCRGFLPAMAKRRPPSDLDCAVGLAAIMRLRACYCAPALPLVAPYLKDICLGLPGLARAAANMPRQATWGPVDIPSSLLTLAAAIHADAVQNAELTMIASGEDADIEAARMVRIATSLSHAVGEVHKARGWQRPPADDTEMLLLLRADMGKDAAGAHLMATMLSLFY